MSSLDCMAQKNLASKVVLTEPFNPAQLPKDIHRLLFRVAPTAPALTLSQAA